MFRYVPTGPRVRLLAKRRGAVSSDLGILGKGKCVPHVDPKIADRVLDLAVAEKDLDGRKLTGRSIDDRCLGSAE